MFKSLRLTCVGEFQIGAIMHGRVYKMRTDLSQLLFETHKHISFYVILDISNKTAFIT